MEKPRRKQSDIIDTLSKMPLTEENYPSISIDSLEYKGKMIDILTIHNTYNTPLYLNRNYGGMLQGCIYSRIVDKNTPNGGNADGITIERLWKKDLGY